MKSNSWSSLKTKKFVLFEQVGYTTSFLREMSSQLS